MDWDLFARILLMVYSIFSLISICYLVIIKLHIDKAEQFINKNTILNITVKVLSITFLFMVFIFGIEKILCCIPMKCSGHDEYLCLVSVRYSTATISAFLLTALAVQCYYESYLLKRILFIREIKGELRKILTTDGLRKKLEQIKKNYPYLVSGKERNVPFTKFITYRLILEEIQERHKKEILQG